MVPSAGGVCPVAMTYTSSSPVCREAHPYSGRDKPDRPWAAGRALYLCFFGMHVLTPTVMEILARRVEALLTTSVSVRRGITLSDALAELALREKYTALEEHAQRFDVGVKYGLLTAQLALALSGRDREDVLARLVELLSTRELGREPRWAVRRVREPDHAQCAHQGDCLERCGCTRPVARRCLCRHGRSRPARRMRCFESFRHFTACTNAFERCSISPFTGSIFHGRDCSSVGRSRSAAMSIYSNVGSRRPYGPFSRSSGSRVPTLVSQVPQQRPTTGWAFRHSLIRSVGVCARCVVTNGCSGWATRWITRYASGRSCGAHAGGGLYPILHEATPVRMDLGHSPGG